MSTASWMVSSAVVTLLLIGTSSDALSVSGGDVFTLKAHFTAADNPCTSHWTSANISNDIVCPTSGDEVGEYMIKNGIHWRMLPMLIGILALFPCCCCILSFRYCCQCCGGSAMRPGNYCCPGDEKFDKLECADIIDEHYSFASTCVVKILTIVPIVMGALAIWFCVQGAVEVNEGFDKTFTAIGDGWEFFIQLGEHTIGNITNPNNTSDFPEGFYKAIIEEYITQMRDLKTSTLNQTTSARTFVNSYAIYPAYVMAVPAALMIFAGISAACNIRICLPCVVILLSFLMQFFYMVLGSILLLFLVPLELGCSEVTSTNDPSARGLVNWYAIPHCDENLPFQSLFDQLKKLELETSEKVCEGLLNVCDDTDSWSYSTNPDKVFRCNLTSATQCQDFETVSGTVSSMLMKSVVTTFSVGGTFFETCGGHTNNCTLGQCAKTCDRDEVRTTTATAVLILDALVRVKYALNNILFPWLNCAKLFKKIANSGPVQACDTVIGGLTKMQNGCLVVGSALLFTTWVCFLGQKRFACPSAVSEEEPIDDVESREGIEMGSVIDIPTNKPTHFNDNLSNRNPSYNNNKNKLCSITSPCSTSNSATFNPLSPTSPGFERYYHMNTSDEQGSNAECRRGDSTVIVRSQSASGDTVRSSSRLQNSKVSPTDSNGRETSTPVSPRAENDCQDIATDNDEINYC